MLGSRTSPATHTADILERLDRLRPGALQRRARATDRELFNLGITFTVYTDKDAIDRVLPFDVIPRVLSAADWSHINAGCIQRVTAINQFIEDVYGAQRILKEGVVPSELVVGNSNYRREMAGHQVAFGSYVNVCGIDIVRDSDGVFRVLEDNARTPSGVSYVVENRHLMLRAFPDLADRVQIRPVSDYGMKLREALSEIAAPNVLDPKVALLSPGVYNSAYFEHVFLAREMGVPLVEGRDLVIDRGFVQMRTTSGLQQVDVLYRRIDDDFIDPAQFNPDSVLGVRGLFEAYRSGNVALANSVGTGVADDKAIYAYMPRIIRFYLSEDPILKNVETHLCREEEGLKYTLANL
ncbi:MAG: circularly permuted type 2 ATP-grasp protein, partial [Gammaproteobacteria bacterium]|nr:circularly permuted type 2 ATP-grasp protein [Gammaproteobacteria bacterium]